MVQTHAPARHNEQPVYASQNFRERTEPVFFKKSKQMKTVGPALENLRAGMGRSRPLHSAFN
eukprot:356721-Chlamydomonas_euryale.AAC.2